MVRRILTIGHSYVVRANRALAHALQAEGKEEWEVRVVAPAYFHGTRDLRPVAFRGGEREPCPVAAVPAWGTRWVHTFVYHWPALRRALHGRWDILHAWEEPYILAGAELAAAAPRCSRFVFRTAQSSRNWYPPPFGWLEQYTLARSAGWICSGQIVAYHLQQRPEYARKPMALIPLGVDVERFRPDPAASAVIRQQLGWSREGPPVIGFLGRLTEEKGIRLLLEVLPRLPLPWRALFVGTGPLEGEIRAWSQHLDPQRIRICTHVDHDHVHWYVNAMDLLVAPSQTTPRWREQFGRMLIEAMACGVPVAGSDSGEIPYVIGDAGLVLPETDPAAWVAGLASLLDSPARRRELAAAGRERACQRYAWPVVARQHLRFFQQLLDMPRND